MRHDVLAGRSVTPTALALPGVLMLQRALIWLVGASGGIVFIEPSPYELVTLVAIVLFFATGLRLRLVFMPMILLLVAINLGYSIGASAVFDDPTVGSWVATSWYMAVTMIFFAMAFAEDTGARLVMLRGGLITGAMIASLAAIAGYFNLVPGGHDLLTLYERARGTFKDPNVLGAFLILPALFVLQNVVTAPFGKAFRSAIILGIISLAVLLAFSRAAWGQLILTSAFMLALMVLTSRSRGERSRIVVVTLVAVVAVVLLLSVLLSFDSIAGLFRERASFEQSYDGGRFGRFGRHVLGAQMALDLPWGLGPLQFEHYFTENTHNSFLNAFMTGGWLSGTAYPALVFLTVVLGFRHVFIRVPWQRAYIAIFSALLGTVGESFIIDTDHWRHFWMVLGIVWATAAAAQPHKSPRPPIANPARWHAPPATGSSTMSRSRRGPKRVPTAESANRINSEAW